MSLNNKFRLYHSYLDLVKQGDAVPVLCTWGHGQCYASLDAEKSDNPLFKCPACTYTVYLGLDEWQKIYHMVKHTIPREDTID